MARIELNVDLNRVEGDLSIQVTLEDGVVAEARTAGTMYRGFEQILQGRAPRDAMVITPRVWGICGTAHLDAAVLGPEEVWRTPVPMQMPSRASRNGCCTMMLVCPRMLFQSFSPLGDHGLPCTWRA